MWSDFDRLEHANANTRTCEDSMVIGAGLMSREGRAVAGQAGKRVKLPKMEVEAP